MKYKLYLEEEYKDSNGDLEEDMFIERNGKRYKLVEVE